ncbi:LAQU0S04e01926g1_1 [Lachancea quebecensis]|uniref:LAQU0S04e01926g1_1 n=1 Tax=Lachancea quebecensis TaxID=1654605 RepID=A0A0P1KXP2_9SACH|nr:LAQU0S04e01926g1_1 [Lachancea quebecensis]
MSPIGILKNKESSAGVFESSRIPLGQYIFERLASSGTRTIFGVPGDFNLSLLEHIYNPEVALKGIKWIGTCNELNAAYAADGYSRYTNKIGCLITTLGVGELSALNGIAGAFAEDVKILHIVGVAPSQFYEGRVQNCHNVHHLVPAASDSNFCAPDHRVYHDMVDKRISCSSAFLDDLSSACDEIDTVISDIYRNSKPGYLFVPADYADKLVDARNMEIRPTITLQDVVSGISVNNHKCQELAEYILELMYDSSRPAIIADVLCDRYGLTSSLRELVNQTHVWNFASAMGKSILDESNPGFRGVYNGSESQEQVVTDIQSCDFLLHVGIVRNEMNTGHYSYKFSNYSKIVELHPEYVNFIDTDTGKTRCMTGQYFFKVLDTVKRMVDPTKLHLKYQETAVSEAQETCGPPHSPVTHSYLQTHFPKLLSSGDVFVVDTGSFQFGVRDYRFPSDLKYISQSFYLSIGMALPCALGVGLGMQDYPSDHIISSALVPKNYQPRLILCEGDGAAQMTIQELTSFLRYNVSLDLFIWNNGGYTVERAIKGPNRSYNDIMSWEWTEILRVFGDPKLEKSVSHKVSSTGQMAKLLETFKRANQQNKLVRLVEVILGVMDFPEQLKSMAVACRH